MIKADLPNAYAGHTKKSRSTFSFIKAFILPIGLTLCVPFAHAAPQIAAFDAVLKVPKCVGDVNDCQTGSLVIGRGSVGPEANSPNTLFGACVDSSVGGYHADESLDAIQVWTNDGLGFSAGKTVNVRATVWAYSGYSSDKLDIYYSPTINAPSWRLISTLTPTKGGSNLLQVSFPLVAGDNQQVIRAAFRYGGTASICDASSYSDRDDLVIPMMGGSTVPTPDTIAPTVSVSAPSNNSTVTGITQIQVSASDNVAVTKVNFYDGASLLASTTVAPYSFNWDTSSATGGMHTIKATAFDAAGNQASTSITVTVLPPLPPQNAFFDMSFANGIGYAADSYSPAIQTGAIAVDPSGSIFTAGRDGFSIYKFSVNGVKDLNWNGTGLFSSSPGSSCIPPPNASIALQSDGKVLAVGTACRSFTSSILDAAILRLNSNGTPDTSFGTSQTGYVFQHSSTNNNTLVSKVLFYNSMIYVVGQDGAAGFVSRYDMSGNRDFSFGSAGIALINIGGSSTFVTDIKILGDGKIALAAANFDQGYLFAAIRLLPNGSVDTTFNGSGSRTIRVGTAILNLTAYPTSLAIDASGNYYLGGYAQTDTQAINKMALVKINNLGSLDVTWNGTGITVLPIGQSDAFGRSVLVAPGGKILLGGSSFQGSVAVPTLVKFTSTGALDNSFGSGGILQQAIPGEGPRISAMAFQPSGLLVATGTASGLKSYVFRFFP